MIIMGSELKKKEQRMNWDSRIEWLLKFGDCYADN